MMHRTYKRFWGYYGELPAEVQRLADKNYALLKADPMHPSLHFKKIKLRGRELWSVRVGEAYRALARENEPGIFSWFWIGTHAEYDRLIK
jgi:hypothetical protein